MATLSIVEGPAQGERFALERHRLVMVGRDATCTFQIVDEHISRKHLQIALEEETGDHYAIDVGSANGVVLNGAAISPRSRHLLQEEIAVIWSKMELDPISRQVEILAHFSGEFVLLRNQPPL